MTDELRELEPRPPRVTVKVHKSSSRDGGIGWELTVADGASDEDVSEVIRKAVAGHGQLETALLGVGGEP